MTRPQELLPLAQFSNLNDREIYNTIKLQFMRPFKVIINSDKAIDKVFFHGEEPQWSINLKKGLLNMLQVNYDKQPNINTNKQRDTESTWNKVIWEVRCCSYNCSSYLLTILHHALQLKTMTAAENDRW